MTLLGKDHYDMMEFFEKHFVGTRMDREPKELWAKGRVYQNGDTNNLFLAFRHGVAYGAAA